MRIYSPEDERRIRLQAHVRRWTRAGLLDAAQGSALDTQLRTDLKRTNIFLRLVIAFFTTSIVSSALGLTAVAFSIRSEGALAFLLGVAAVIAAASANWIVSTARVYRFGIEEALANGAVALACGAVVLAMSIGGRTPSLDAALTAALAVAAVGLFFVYRRYGYEYSAIAAMVAVALLPFVQWPAYPTAARIASAALLAIICAVASSRHGAHGDDYPGDEYAALQAAAWLGTYLVLNLWISDPLQWSRIAATATRWFYWTTYACVWILPAIGLWLAIRDRNRYFIAANLAMALATLVTNKLYLGWPRYSWDPMILGGVLIGGAVGARRWLGSGPSGMRGAYTAERMFERDRDIVAALGTAAAVLHPASAVPPPARPSSPGFGGGRSGGAGASGSF